MCVLCERDSCFGSHSLCPQCIHQVTENGSSLLELVKRELDECKHTGSFTPKTQALLPYLNRVKESDGSASRLLHTAVDDNERLPLAKALVAAGHRADDTDEVGLTPLMMAASHGADLALKWMLEDVP